MNASSSASVPAGAWPVLLTPFTDTRAIDWDGVARLVDYYASAGVGGIFAVCLSGEMFQMNDRERLDLARHVVKCAAGRVPVIASAIAGADAAEQTRAVLDTAATGVAGVVLLPCLIADEHESDAVWRSRLETIVTGTEGVALGFYECPRPYKRAVSPADLAWAAKTGRFVFHKDTTHDLDRMKTKIALCRGTPLKFFNTQMGTLIDTLTAGGHGFSSYAANLYPELVHWVCTHHADRPADALRVQQLLAIAEYMINNKYPASAKVFIRENAGVPIGSLCRATYDVMTRHECLSLLALIDYVRSLTLPVPLASLKPTTGKGAA